MKIRSRILMNTAVVSLLVGVTFMLIIYFVLKADFERSAYKSLLSHLNLFAANLDEHFVSSGEQLQNIAANTALFKMNSSALSSDLKDVKSLIMEFRSVSYLNLNGDVVASSNSRLIGKNINKEAPGFKNEFKKALSNKKNMIVFSPLKNCPNLLKLTSDSLELQMLTAVFDDRGNRIGVLSAFFDVNLVANHVDFVSKTMGRNSQVYLLNSDEMDVISSNKKLRFLESFSDTGIIKIKKMIGENRVGYDIIKDRSAKKILMGFVWLRKNENSKVPNWILVVKEPYTNITRSLGVVFSDFFIVFIISVLLIGGFATVDSYYLTKPLKLLVSANKRLAGGNYRKIFYEKNNEVGDVVKAFNHAVEKIQNTTEELAENEELFRNLAESTSAGIFIIQDAKIVYVNRAATKIFGFIAEELYKMNFWDVVHPDYTEMIRDYGLSRQRGEDVPKQYEFKAVTKKGEEKWISMSAGSVLWRGKVAGIGTAIDLTEKKNTEEKLRFEEHRLRQAQRMGKISFMDWDLKTNLVEVSFEGMLLLGLEEGNKKYKFEDVAKMVHPDDINYVIKNVFDARDGKSKLDIQYRIKPANGAELFVWSTGELILDEDGKAIRFLGTMQDITERKRYEESLKLFRVLIDGASDAIEVVDPKTFKYIDVNERGCLDLGYSREEFLKLSVMDIDPTANFETVGAIMPELKKAGSIKWEGRHQRKNGTTFPVEVNMKMVNFSEEKEYVVAVVRDITERKQTEQKLIEAKEKAEESERLKSAFLANMSHEIRTPMNGILGFAELLREPKLTRKEQEMYLSIIEKSGTRMLSTVNDIIDISKIESGQMTVSVSETNINEQMDFVYNFFKPEADLKELDLRLKKDLPDNKSYINTDKEKFYGILTNLVKNAIKFTHKGHIELGYVRKNETLEFYVEDTGTGIPEEIQESVFGRFVQGSTSLTRNYEGSGLGLTITKAYVEMLGGEIWLESHAEDTSKKESKDKETGSTFFFTLPYDNIGKEKVVSEGSLDETENFNGKIKVLVAEDDEISEQLIIRIVKPFSSEVLVSRNGLDAVEKCRNNNDIDLVFMDIKMPGMDGYEATREIRKFNKKVIIIAETAFALTGDKEKALEAGCNDYLSKPVKIDALNKIIKTYFG